MLLWLPMSCRVSVSQSASQRLESQGASLAMLVASRRDFKGGLLLGLAPRVWA